jgi:hypothetical protein
MTYFAGLTGFRLARVDLTLSEDSDQSARGVFAVESEPAV